MWWCHFSWLKLCRFGSCNSKLRRHDHGCFIETGCTSNELTWLQHFLQVLGFSGSTPIPLLCDNHVAIHYTWQVTNKMRHSVINIIYISLWLKGFFIFVFVFERLINWLLFKRNLVVTPSHILRDAFVLWLTTLSWSHTHLAFEGGC